MNCISIMVLLRFVYPTYIFLKSSKFIQPTKKYNNIPTFPEVKARELRCKPSTLARKPLLKVHAN